MPSPRPWLIPAGSLGDGGLTMLMGEIVTCVKYKLDVKIVVIKNNSLGQIKWEQMVFLGRRNCVRLWRTGFLHRRSRKMRRDPAPGAGDAGASANRSGCRSE
jgi:TPP-dependent trihydroxycyclohexane-1,2-dione (THcHDO) dehydratase